MTAFTSSTRVGPPLSGAFVVGDAFTDAVGTVYECKKSGKPGLWDLRGPITIASTTTFNVGTAFGAGNTVVEEGSGTGFHRTTFTFALTPVNVADATQFGGTKIYDFPEGRILVLGATASLAPVTTTVIATTINSGVAGAVAVGTVTASAISLTTTMADLIPSTAVVTSTVINVAAATVTAALAASAQFDGTATKKSAFLNSSITTATDIDADGTIAYNGTLTISWVFLGDY